MDTVFGTFVNDKMKLVNHRAVRNGIHHRHQITPLDPEPGDAVTVHVQTPGEAGYENVALYYTTDGSAPIGSRGVAKTGTAVPLTRAKVEWDTPIWGYLIHWQATIPGQPDQTMVQYAISAWTEEGEEIFADWPNVDEQVHHATMKHFKSIPEDTPLILTELFPGEEIFNYHVDTIKTPQWAENAVIYHIFIDRFYPGDGKEWLETEPISKACGGTLWGVRDKLDYLADLGVDGIWLSPTWLSPTWHGYDVMDYGRIEPRLGGEEALRAVIEGAHQRGIRVLFDMVCNHLSNQHPIFVEALNDENSPYRNWFFFDERVTNGYKSFFGVAEMPRINLNIPAARDWMIANAVRWIEDFDIDGYRLDVADGPGPSFWPHFRKACRSVKPDCLIFGEIIDTPQRLRTYAGRLDGCLDFPLNDALRRTFGWETMTPAQISSFIADNAAYYPENFIVPAFLDNHDMNRFSYAAGNDVRKMKRAAEFLFSLPNLVVIYYGSEVGMEQHQSILETGGYRASRAPMAWGEQQNQELFSFYKHQIHARKRR